MKRERERQSESAGRTFFCVCLLVCLLPSSDELRHTNRYDFVVFGWESERCPPLAKSMKREGCNRTFVCMCVCVSNSTRFVSNPYTHTHTEWERRVKKSRQRKGVRMDIFRLVLGIVLSARYY